MMPQVLVFLTESKGGIFKTLIPQIYSGPTLICKWPDFS